MPATSNLYVDVHIAPMRPMAGAPPQGPGDESMWSPMSATLIHGERDAVLVDTLVTFDQVDTLADWIDRFEKNLTTIYITHGHSDHWIGLKRLLERFPSARGLARPQVHDRAAFEATNPGLSAYWQSVFPGEVPGDPVLPDRFEETSMDLEGHTLEIVDIGRGDTEHSTIVHSPSIAAVVGGDVVYNEVHMMMGEAGEAARDAWIRSLDQIAALQPQVVVSGHQRVAAPSVPKTIGESQQYLRDFTRVANSQDTVEGIVAEMLELHPDRDNPRVVWHSAREEIKRRQSA
jgi:glyoxylase-like metal-dependent hydrolase (beta-lactamase superfamily II)